MNLFISYLAIFLIITFSIFKTDAAKNAVAKFKCDLAVFERCVSTLFVNADETFVYPTNLKEMNATCK